MNYSILLNEISKDNNDNIEEANLNFFKNSITTYLSFDTFIDEEKFLKLVKNEYQHIRKKQEHDFKEIKAIIEHNLCMYDVYKNRINEVFNSI